MSTGPERITVQVTDQDIQDILDRAEPGVGSVVDQYDTAARFYIASVVTPSIQIVASSGTVQP